MNTGISRSNKYQDIIALKKATAYNLAYTREIGAGKNNDQAHDIAWTESEDVSKVFIETLVV